MKVLIACEYSGVVREAFKALGHTALSCDLRETELSGAHFVGDVREILTDTWDLMIAHPPCTHLAVSGARWFPDKKEEQREALEFVQLLMDAPIRHIAIENPIGIISSKIRKPDQIIQPWMFGDSYQKSTCLWLKNLPKIVPTNVVDKGEFVIHGGKKIPRWYSNREINRDRTFQGIANAMAQQWGNIC